jgi:hypothetical protein
VIFAISIEVPPKAGARLPLALRRLCPGRAAAPPEWLAYHCDEAGRPEKATQHWRAAGEQAVHRAEHFRRALLRNAERSAGVERLRTELRIASLSSLFYFAIFLDSTKRIFPDSGVPYH